MTSMRYFLRGVSRTWSLCSRSGETRGQDGLKSETRVLLRVVGLVPSHLVNTDEKTSLTSLWVDPVRLGNS